MFRLAALLIFCLPIPATANPPVNVRVVLGDGSVIYGELKTEAISVATAYGILTVPVEEVFSIHTGLHLTTDDAHAITTAIGRLGSSIHRERDSATAVLTQMGRRSLLALLKASKSNDPETAKRAQAIYFTLIDAKMAVPLDYDVVVARQMTLKGRMVIPHLEVHGKILGKVMVTLPDLVELRSLAQTSTTFFLDAEKHGSKLDQWYNTGIALNRHSELKVMAFGTVDLWPVDGLKSYVAQSPKGYTSAGKGGNFMAAALIGRIGSHGREFLIGEKYHAAISEEGTLHLLIVPSDWNVSSAGGYEVKIEVKSR